MQHILYIACCLKAFANATHIHTHTWTCSLAHMAINPSLAVGLKLIHSLVASRQSQCSAAQTKMRIIPAKSLEIWQSPLSVSAARSCSRSLSLSLPLPLQYVRSISLSLSLSRSRRGTKRFARAAFSFSSSYICQANGITVAIATTSKPNKNVICRFAQKSSTQPNNSNNNSNQAGQTVRNSQKQLKPGKTACEPDARLPEPKPEPEKVVVLRGCWPGSECGVRGAGCGMSRGYQAKRLA